MTSIQRPLDGIRVLLVEDDRDGLELLELCLREEGAIVTTATTGAEARVAIASGAQDVLISDLSLPDEDGCMLLTSIRASSSHSNIPAIALTGRAEDEAVVRAIEAGFDKHMAKPADLTDLAATVRALASRRGGVR
jgi:DNA-binding response OmpR family regulator